MELGFIRQQMQAKLEEFKLYNSLYLESALKEKSRMAEYLTKEEVDEFDELIEQLKEFSEGSVEMVIEIDIVSARFSLTFEEYRKRLSVIVAEQQEQLTHDDEGITITRHTLQYSNFALSAGYDEANRLMDIEYSGGKVYRYKNVPVELFEKIRTKNSLKGFRQELGNYEFIKLS